MQILEMNEYDCINQRTGLNFAELMVSSLVLTLAVRTEIDP
jgi:hypothetical protein